MPHAYNTGAGVYALKALTRTSRSIQFGLEGKRQPERGRIAFWPREQSNSARQSDSDRKSLHCDYIVRQGKIDPPTPTTT